ncbi:MAG TPA: peptidylprolyl isomerase [Mycobacteriales bacterium]|nr:peptidylprolyl isomerase [Mycobacteriales bacterium]
MPTTKQRRENARRRLERQIQRRQEAQAARKRRNLVTAAAFGVILVVGAVFLLVTQLGGDDNTPAAAAPTPSASTAPVKGECTYSKDSAAATKDVGQPPNGKVATTGTVTATVSTTQGDMTFVLDRSKAPCTVNSFTYLAGKKYYDNTPCHRITTAPTFGVLQCGDPGGTGSGGPGYQYADELDANGKYTKGVLAMANAGANTNGSQFFVVYKDTDLKPNYTIFGTVTKGLDVVEKVAKGGAPNNDGKPNTPIQIKTVTLGS